ncbi:hypothetical protein HMPREF1487_09452 [Pseudomonas sp. HPB0071]|uniref:Uncharacterized protein n=1 Tax=Pseudomonas luteola TaxID=47886 RepID=A0A2X2C374_PSELU|nr:MULTISPECIES: hypothetical protein [Pseudomonas]ENA26973.1 hypothetical protein HMPREF1487_09452 [Pseudomonas sp. HPB0071]MBA1250198.1 hypothetical protein [Pseudomonas zeshuii]MBH3440949.1 hypothetical protein [Pseudomonas luteola]SPY99946.1 Uncharacterised protein [Pseudomonas luteola]
MPGVSESLRERAKGLLQRYRADTNDNDLNIGSLVNWLDERVTVHGIGITTAKCYRRWLASYVESIGHPEAAKIRNWVPPGSKEEALVTDAEDAKQFEKVMVAGVAQNNALYLSYIHANALDALLDDLMVCDEAGTPKYSSGPSAALFFTATLMMGLRPHEWRDARYLETFYDPETKLTLGPVLEVITLKQYQRREDNPLRSKRYLLLDEIPEQRRMIIKALLAEVQAQAEGFEDYLGRTRKALSRAWKRVINRNPSFDVFSDKNTANVKRKAKGSEVEKKRQLSVSLYTARHIFAEEVRRSHKYTRFELAAMLGHTMLTNQIYYGPRSINVERGHSFPLPRPWPGDAEDIMEWDHKVNPLRFRFAQGDLFGGHTEPSSTSEDRDGASSFYMR